jgi:hypothetical protein
MIGCSAAVLLAYVGLVHEVVGSTLYPHGPAAFGGLVGWHGAGLALVALGGWAAAGILGASRAPVRLLGAVGAVAGGVVVAEEALQHGDLHFFALTMVVAGVVVVSAGPGRPRP